MKKGVDYVDLCEEYLSSCDLVKALIAKGYRSRGAARRAAPYIEKDRVFIDTLFACVDRFVMKTISDVARGQAKKEAVDAAQKLQTYIRTKFGYTETGEGSKEGIEGNLQIPAWGSNPASPAPEERDFGTDQDGVGRTEAPQRKEDWNCVENINTDFQQDGAAQADSQEVS